jgi:hypothetical protein
MGAALGQLDAPKLASDLTAAEYDTVREEWLAARSAQQQTWRWSLASNGVLFAAILGSDARTKEPLLFVVLAAAAVLFATASQVIFLGEFQRMERAALFLRAREQALNAGLPRVAGQPPLLWETWRASAPPSRNTPWIPGAGPLIVAGLGLYAGMVAGGLVALGSAALDSAFSPDERILACVLGAVAGLLYAGVTVFALNLGRRLWSVRRLPADLTPLFEQDASSSKEPARVEA